MVGLLNGVLARGLLPTPQALHASRQGMVWDVEKEIWKFYALQEEKNDKQAYRREARALHPDKNPGNETAAELFHQLQGLYDIE